MAHLGKTGTVTGEEGLEALGEAGVGTTEI